MGSDRLCKLCGKNELTYEEFMRSRICLACINIDDEKNKLKKICHLISTHIPIKYQNIESDNPELKRWQDESLFITGNPGTGKTVLAASIGKKILRCLNLLDFIKYPAFIMQIQGAFKKEQEDPYEMARSVAQFPGVLIIDDLGAEKLTDFVRQITYYILNEREQNCGTTIITSNFSLSQLDEQFDSRISSRIAGMCRIVKMTGDDRRIVK